MNKERLLKLVDELLEGKDNSEFLTLHPSLMSRLAEVENAAYRNVAGNFNRENIRRILKSTPTKILVLILLTGPIIAQIINTQLADSLLNAGL